MVMSGLLVCAGVLYLFNSKATKPRAVSVGKVLHLGKSKSPFKIKVQRKDESLKPLVPGESVTLKAQVSSLRYAGHYEYSWVLPEDVEVVGGDVQGTVESGNTHAFLLTVKTARSENQYIYFKVKVRNSPLHGSGQFNTTQQAEFDEKRRRLQEMNNVFKK